MTLLSKASRYIFLLLILMFAIKDYTYLARRSEEKKAKIIRSQKRILVIFEILAYAIIFMNTRNPAALILLAGILIYFGLTHFLYRTIYPESSALLVNNMLMLLGIGFVMIGRLKMDQAVKQFVIAAAGTAFALIVPVIIRKLRILSRLTWLYAIIGILALLGVLALASVSGGAKLSISIGGVTIQFSELVKITLVFFLASKLAKDSSFKSALVASIVAAMHVGILVLSTDLGTALVFFVTYLVLILVATRDPKWPLAGTGVGIAGAFAAYHLFNHVRQRVAVWRNPFAYYNTTGYQIVQGLFAIGAGGWFGTGLCLGRPNTIPVSTKDFIFAAICEEFGSLFAICMLLVCMSLFILIVNISMSIRNRFYKLVALGLGCEYAFQVFLTVGGVTKFIPMTGITLPLVSYGGSSVVSTIIMLAIIQGLYILREDEGEEIALYTRSRANRAGNRG